MTVSLAELAREMPYVARTTISGYFSSFARLFERRRPEATRQQQPQDPFDLSERVVDEEELRYVMTKPTHARDRLENTLNPQQVSSILGSKTHQKILDMMENGKTGKLAGCADWGPYFAHYELQFNGNMNYTMRIAQITVFKKIT